MKIFSEKFHFLEPRKIILWNPAQSAHWRGSEEYQIFHLLIHRWLRHGFCYWHHPEHKNRRRSQRLGHTREGILPGQVNQQSLDHSPLILYILSCRFRQSCWHRENDAGGVRIIVSVIVSSKLETATFDSVLFRAGSFTICLRSLLFAQLTTSQIATVALQGTGPVAINVEHRLACIIRLT